MLQPDFWKYGICPEYQDLGNTKSGPFWNGLASLLCWEGCHGDIIYFSDEIKENVRWQQRCWEMGKWWRHQYSCDIKLLEHQPRTCNFQQGLLTWPSGCLFPVRVEYVPLPAFDGSEGPLCNSISNFHPAPLRSMTDRIFPFFLHHLTCSQPGVSQKTNLYWVLAECQVLF